MILRKFPKISLYLNKGDVHLFAMLSDKFVHALFNTRSLKDIQTKETILKKATRIKQMECKQEY